MNVDSSNPAQSLGDNTYAIFAQSYFRVLAESPVVGGRGGGAAICDARARNLKLSSGNLGRFSP